MPNQIRWTSENFGLYYFGNLFFVVSYNISVVMVGLHHNCGDILD